MRFVAVVAQGVVLDVKALAVGGDEEALKRDAEVEAERLNAQQQGEFEAYVPMVVPVDE